MTVVRSSVRSSVHLSGAFLRIGSLNFSVFCIRAKVTQLKNGRSPIFEKKNFYPFWVKIGPKWAQNRVFRYFLKILSLKFSDFPSHPNERNSRPHKSHSCHMFSPLQNFFYFYKSTEKINNKTFTSLSKRFSDSY